MKKILIFLTFFPFLIFSNNEETNITLKQQMVLDLCGFPNLKEGIIDILYLTIENYWHIGDYSKIFPLFKLITQISPTDVNAYCLGGWFLINGIASKYEGSEKERIKKYAVEFMKEGIEKEPNDYRLYFELAWFYYKEGYYEKSLEYLEKAEKYQHSFYVENLKAHIYMKINKKEKAIEEWEKIKRMYPERKEIAEKYIKKLIDEEK